jgi:hypothetical protein
VGTAGTSAARRAVRPGAVALLTPVVRECDPQAIQVNISHTHAFSDGLTAGEWEQMQRAIPEPYRDRVVRRELLPLQYIEERLPEMLPTYVRMQELVHEIIATAFSAGHHAGRHAHPGRGLVDAPAGERPRPRHWFQPSVSVQRRGVEMGDSANPVILRGDVLHTDFGITALGLNTDTQHMGYVLREGETDAAGGAAAALRNSNRLQDILLEEMVPGRTGNEVLRSTLERMRAEGLDGTMYTHPIGDHGHGAGPTIGLWDRQEGVPGRGDVPLRPNTWFSIELQATTPVPSGAASACGWRRRRRRTSTLHGERHWVLRRQEQTVPRGWNSRGAWSQSSSRRVPCASRTASGRTRCAWRSRRPRSSASGA